MDIPLQGTPGVLDYRNPTLLPNTDVAVAVGGGVTALQSPADFLAANPRVNATNALTLGGTITNLDNITLNLTHKLLTGGVLTKVIPVVTGNTLATIAEKIAVAFNDDAQCQALQILVDPVGAVVTFNWPGLVGNLAVLTGSVSGAATETLTFSPVGGGLTGGSGPIVPVNNFQYAYGNSIQNFRYGEPVFADPPLVAALVADGMPIV